MKKTFFNILISILEDYFKFRVTYKKNYADVYRGGKKITFSTRGTYFV